MNKRFLANGFLGLATIGSIATFKMGGLIHHACLAAMIGGCADWFAVTALFHRPLGIKYRTEILKNNRERLMTALVEYISTDLLSAENILEDFLEQELKVQIPIPKSIAQSVLDKAVANADTQIKIKIPAEIIESALKSERIRSMMLNGISNFKKEYASNGVQLRAAVMNMLGEDEQILKMLEGFLIQMARDKFAEEIHEFHVPPESIDAMKQNLDSNLENLTFDLDVRPFLKQIVTKYHGEIPKYLTNYLNGISDEDLTKLVESKVDDDLQAIRINGAIVGGLAGAGLFLIAHFLTKILI